MTRENFPGPARDQIAAFAGQQCSFPACNRRTSGPGPDSEYLSHSGYAAHIYSASSGGPRGQGDLTPEELKAPGNGIWLCGTHAKLVDNHRGTAYPPETLLSYKALHEARVALEHEGLYPPIGWIHEIEIVSSPLFIPQQRFQLAKLNLIYGNNDTGKSAITEWITGFFDSAELFRWLPTVRSPIHVRLSLLNPKLQHLSLKLLGSDVRYEIEGTPVAFIPIGMRVFKPARPDYSIHDDLEMLSQVLRVPPLVMPSLLDEVNRFPHSTVSALRFQTDPETSRTVLIADVHGTAPGLSLRSLSGREQERVVMELATAAARLSGRYCPTLLVLDAAPPMIFTGFFDYYSHHLLDPVNQFQTLMCVPQQQLDIQKVTWNGWQVIRTEGTPPGIRIHQSNKAE